MLATLLIVFREVIESGLIVGIVLAATQGVARRSLWVGYGVAGGIAGACLVAAFADQIAMLFAGSGQELFNAGVLLLAVGMLTWHNVWMASHGRAIARQMRQVGAEVAAGDRPLTALSIVCGLAVLREGSEVVLFLYGIAASGGTSAAGMLAGGALGLLVGAGVSALMYRGLLTIPARHLFSVTSGLITLLAAGLAAQAVAFLQQAGYIARLTSTVWDSSWLLSDESLAGRMLHTLIGYTTQPTGAQLVVYLVTVAVIVALMRLVHPPRADARKAAALSWLTNPTGKPHAQPGGSDHHAGDMPMLEADSSGKATLTAELAGITIGSGPTDIIGKAVIVHKDADDYKTQPTGNSGARVACGVINKS